MVKIDMLTARQMQKVDELLPAYLNTVKAYLLDQRGTFPRIAEKADVPLYWLRTFANGRNPDPRFNKLRRLYAALTNQDLPEPVGMATVEEAPSSSHSHGPASLGADFAIE